MSDQSRRKFERILILIRKDQEYAIQSDADTRYPERHGPTQKKRNFSPALRDILDFWIAHYDIFLSWLTTRG